MADEVADVTPAPSPGTQDVAAAASTASTDVPSVPSDGDRSVENMFRELQRRDQDRQRQIDSVLAWIGAQAQAPRAPAAPAAPNTDDELWSMAQQGDRQAFEEYQRRVAQRELYRHTAQRDRSQLVVSQLNVLVSKYPVLRDPSHALTQTAQQMYTALVGQGYQVGNETMLEAVKTAIADRPDIVADLHTQGAQLSERSRATATSRAQTGMTGASGRHASTPVARERVVSPEETALASRMGVKDPKGAKDRFVKRMDTGQSALGAVGAFPSVVKEMEEF